MKVVFDAAKDALNLTHHGVSLALASQLEWDTLIAKPDIRKEYGEVRMIGYALLGERPYCVIFTDRGDTRRIISLRKANNREKDHYVSNH